MPNAARMLTARTVMLKGTWPSTRTVTLIMRFHLPRQLHFRGLLAQDEVLRSQPPLSVARDPPSGTARGPRSGAFQSSLLGSWELAPLREGPRRSIRRQSTIARSRDL